MEYEEFSQMAIFASFILLYSLFAQTVPFLKNLTVNLTNLIFFALITGLCKFSVLNIVRIARKTKESSQNLSNTQQIIQSTFYQNNGSSSFSKDRLSEVSTPSVPSSKRQYIHTRSTLSRVLTHPVLAEVEDFKKSSPQNLDQASHTWANYCKPNSPFAVNLPYIFQKKLEVALSEKTNIVEAFDTAYDEIFTLLLRDSFPRFGRSLKGVRKG